MERYHEAAEQRYAEYYVRCLPLSASTAGWGGI
jgi:hypothetical protein